MRDAVKSSNAAASSRRGMRRVGVANRSLTVAAPNLVPEFPLTFRTLWLHKLDIRATQFAQHIHAGFRVKQWIFFLDDKEKTVVRRTMELAVVESRVKEPRQPVPSEHSKDTSECREKNQQLECDRHREFNREQRLPPIFSA